MFKNRRVLLISFLISFVLFIFLSIALFTIENESNDDFNNQDTTNEQNDFEETNNVDIDELQKQKFEAVGLATDISNSLINLDQVLRGGPAKDGIPALTNPKFVDVDDAEEFITDETLGILIEHNSEVKYYPYNILVWHEIVNDTVGGKDLAITFCPLCGSAIVFEPEIDDEVLEFGVSGLLYESNLLMFDRKTESLWSQIEGRSVIGNFAGEELKLFDFQLLEFSKIKSDYPDALVLDVNTGHNRDYTVYPYGDYEENENLIFQTSVTDERFFSKEIFYAVNYNKTPVAFNLEDLREVGRAEVDVNDNKIIAEDIDGEINVTVESTGEVLPGYFAMWFSWITHNQDGVIWSE